jgi:hypothetical protein
MGRKVRSYAYVSNIQWRGRQVIGSWLHTFESCSTCEGYKPGSLALLNPFSIFVAYAMFLFCSSWSVISHCLQPQCPNWKSPFPGSLASRTSCTFYQIVGVIIQAHTWKSSLFLGCLWESSFSLVSASSWLCCEVMLPPTPESFLPSLYLPASTSSFWI